jgi:hypothetical protein
MHLSSCPFPPVRPLAVRCGLGAEGMLPPDCVSPTHLWPLASRTFTWSRYFNGASQSWCGPTVKVETRQKRPVRGADGQEGTPHVAPATTVRDMIDLNRITGVARQ